MILVTGASGQLGRLVINALLTKTAANQIIAAVRNPDSVADLAAKGVQVRQADYTQPDTLVTAFKGVDKLLLISSNEIGQRTAQHRNVTEAAKTAGVKHIVYTSLLNAPTSPLILAQEHVETEQLIAQSGLAYTLLRNGWYSENYTMSLGAALAHQVVLGCAENGQFSTAARADYAEAAAVVLNAENQAGKIYELAGDNAFSLSDYAAAITQASGQTITYQHVPEAEYTNVLVGAGLPQPLAAVLANAEVGASNGALYSESKALSTLIGRPTTPIIESIKAAL